MPFSRIYSKDLKVQNIGKDWAVVKEVHRVRPCKPIRNGKYSRGPLLAARRLSVEPVVK
jgi:hypothetical protein